MKSALEKEPRLAELICWIWNDLRSPNLIARADARSELRGVEYAARILRPDDLELLSELELVAFIRFGGAE